MHTATKTDMTLLHEYLMKSVTRGSEGVDAVNPRYDVTVLMHFFCPRMPVSDGLRSRGRCWRLGEIVDG